jgi:hypothetical protein
VERLGRLLLDAHLAGVGGQVGWSHRGIVGKEHPRRLPTLKPLLCTQLSLSSQEFDATLAELKTEGDYYQTSYHYYLAYWQR